MIRRAFTDRHRLVLAATVTVLAAAQAVAHTPLFVVVNGTVNPPRMIIAPGSLPTLNDEIDMNYAPTGPYAGLFVTDLPGYDATLFPFSQHPGVQLRLERVRFPKDFGMFSSVGSTTPILEGDGDMRPFAGHTHFVHHVSAPGVYKASFRYVDASGQVGATDVFTLTFRAAQNGVDTDGDGIVDANDNCINDENPDHEDVDDDTVGDACDCCPDDPNRSQLDLNNDEICDACNCDAFPCPHGDVNVDNQVDLIDLIQSRNAFSQNLFPPIPPPLLLRDVNGDQKIDAADLVEIRATWE